MAVRVVASLCCWLTFSAVTRAAEDGALYVTWEGAEPDKGASMWLILRRIDPQARIQVFPFESPLDSGIPFDVPQARHRRTHNTSTLESLLIEYPSDDPVIQKMGQLMHDIEINLWRPKRFPESLVIERTTKTIADRLPNGHISVTCFVALFDEIYSWLKSGQTTRPLSVPTSCQQKHAP